MSAPVDEMLPYINILVDVNNFVDGDLKVCIIRHMDTIYIRKAIRKSKHTQASLARELDVTTQAVNNWLRRGVIPIDQVVALEKLIGVDRRKLCPDFPWPK
jgi:DNA-binding transcriptional regulator YiaG